ncbi:MAG: hypothetical protein IJD17_03015, partial [Clostridia bacterium]|nr:hypothetical protein [Clostridia bacterium]
MNTVEFKNARWIWGEDNTTPDQKMVFRKKFELEDIPEIARTFISCDTKFWLWVNEKEVVWEGGVFRESTPGNGWAEEIDITPYLKRGENVVSALVWFYGNGGRNNSNSGEAGFIMECESIGLATDEEFLCALHPGYVKSGEPRPAYLFGGDNIAFDAHLDFGDFTASDFNEIEFVSAVTYENKVWGESLVSELPILKVGALTECNF